MTVAGTRVATVEMRVVRLLTKFEDMSTEPFLMDCV